MKMRIRYNEFKLKNKRFFFALLKGNHYIFDTKKSSEKYSASNESLAHPFPNLF